MFWNCYIADTKNKAMGKARKERLFIKDTTTGDNRAVRLHAAKHFGVNEDLILCVPTPQNELD